MDKTGKGDKKMSKSCYYCGASVEEQDRFCTACGKPISPEEGQTQSEKHHAEKSGKAEPHLDTEPITVGGYLLMLLILCIPVVNLVVLLLWAFGKNGNVNRRNFSRAALVYVAIGIVLSIGALVFVIGVAANMVQYSQGPYHRYEHYGNPYVENWEYYDEYLPDSTDDFMYSITEGDAPAENLELYGITISNV